MSKTNRLALPGRKRLAARPAVLAALCVALLALSAPGQPPATPSPVASLPQDTGVTGLKLMLRRLNTTARLQQDVAHPDDEDGGMLTLESRGKGASVTLLTLNRGEGGQNKVGSNLFDVLGVLRTLELTAADRYYGVQQRFTRVADFGYSKSSEETFQKWHGHDIALGDMVRVIRTFRPDVLVARFSGTSRDGHGHHEASAILTREAFRAAADPARFPEQIKEGLFPWQAKKLYIGNVCGFMANTCPDENYTLKFNTGEPDPLLGMSYIQFAMEGLRHQLSQGAGGWSVPAGDRFTFYKLVESVTPPTLDKNGHEKDFFDGIDTSLPALASRLGADEAKVEFLKPGLQEMQSDITKAGATVEADPSGAAGPLLAALRTARKLMQEVNTSALPTPEKSDLALELQTKEEQLAKAADLALGADFQVTADVPAGRDADDAFMAVPGQSFKVKAEFSAKTPVEKVEAALDTPPGWKSKLIGKSTPEGRDTWTFEVTLPTDAEYTRPYWHRDDPERDAINQIDNPAYLTLPFPPSPLGAHATYSLRGNEGVAHAVATVSYDSPSGTLDRALAVAPAFSVAVDPGGQVIPVESRGSRDVKVQVRGNLPHSHGALHLQVPDSWQVQPASAAADFQARGETREFTFHVTPTGLKEGTAQIRAVLDSGGKSYSEGYSVVTREDLNTFYYYQPATQRISIVDVKVPAGLKVGYIMGAGDDIPTVLQQLGINVTLIPPDKLAGEDLSQYATIVLGIRVYDTQKEVADYNKKLLDYVSNGGTLVVQYNAGVGDFNAGHFTPYPADLSRARVSVEEAPVEILAPGDSVFHSPNEITQRDFDGWVQERGLYFMDQWDDHFKPLLACHDPGEPPQKGGLLKAKYGKGTYIYTGYAFFRQLPAGVPGAIRLYVNLLASH